MERGRAPHRALMRPGGGVRTRSQNFGRTPSVVTDCDHGGPLDSARTRTAHVRVIVPKVENYFSVRASERSEDRRLRDCTGLTLKPGNAMPRCMTPLGVSKMASRHRYSRNVALQTFAYSILCVKLTICVLHSAHITCAQTQPKEA